MSEAGKIIFRTHAIKRKTNGCYHLVFRRAAKRKSLIAAYAKQGEIVSSAKTIKTVTENGGLYSLTSDEITIIEKK